MQLKVSYKNQLKSIEHLIYYTIITVVVAFYFLMQQNYQILSILGIFYLINAFPTIYLHLEYLFNNLHDVIEIDSFNKKIQINNISTHFNDVKEITLVMAPAWHRKSFIRIFSFEDYHYAKIQLQRGDTFYLTCLMAYPIEEFTGKLKDVRIRKKKNLFCSIKLDKFLETKFLAKF